MLGLTQLTGFSSGDASTITFHAAVLGAVNTANAVVNDTGFTLTAAVDSDNWVRTDAPSNINSYYCEIVFSQAATSATIIYVCNSAWFTAPAKYNATTHGAGGWYVGNGSQGTQSGSTITTVPAVTSLDAVATIGIVINNSARKGRIYRNGALACDITLAADVNGPLYAAFAPWSSGTLMGNFRTTPSAFASQYVCPE